MSWTCPKCERELLKPHRFHNCVKVNINDLLKDQTEEVVLAFDKLLAEIIDWEDVIVSCSKNCIVFVHRQTFFVVRPMKKQLELKFYSEKIPQDIKLEKSIQHPGRYGNHFRLTNLSDLTPKLLMLIRKSYQIL